MILLGVDPHKSTHTATAVDLVPNQQTDSLRIEATLAEYRRLLTWARRRPQRTWVVENANGLGRHLAQWLIARGESVADVPPSATSRIPPCQSAVRHPVYRYYPFWARQEPHPR